MKTMKRIKAAVLWALVLCGCSKADPGVSAPVSSTCSMNAQGMELTMVLHAPALEGDLTSFDLTFKVPFEALKDAANLSEADEFQMDSLISEARSLYQSLLSSSLGVEESSISVEETESDLTFSLSLNDFEKFKELSGIEDQGSIVYQDVLADLEADSRIHCE